MVGKIWNMHKRAFQALKRTFMHVSGLPLPYFDKKTNLIKYLVFYQNMVGKTWNMHKRAFQALKCTFMHVLGLPQQILMIKLNTL